MNTIVFVEDDAEVGSLIAAYLAKHDMQVTVEPRGDQAEETILRENPDLVLLDIMLPGKDGMTICRDLRAKWSGPIVLLTSLDSDMNHILALEMGACDYILKTTPPAVLLARLRLHLRQNEQATLTKGLQETSLTPYFVYLVERGSDKHIAYAASKAALDNMTRSFARKLAPEVKVNSIAPSLILFNEHDDAEYRQQALNKSLMKTAPGEKEVIDLVDYLLTSCFVTGRSFPLDGGRHLR